MKNLITIALLFVSLAVSATEIINIQVSRIYLVDSSARKAEFANRARIKSEQESKGYTFIGLRTINGKCYLTFGRNEGNRTENFKCRFPETRKSHSQLQHNFNSYDHRANR